MTSGPGFAAESLAFEQPGSTLGIAVSAEVAANQDFTLIQACPGIKQDFAGPGFMSGGVVQAVDGVGGGNVLAKQVADEISGDLALVDARTGAAGLK